MVQSKVPLGYILAQRRANRNAYVVTFAVLIPLGILMGSWYDQIIHGQHTRVDRKRREASQPPLGV